MRSISIKYAGPLLFVLPVLAVLVAFGALASWEVGRATDDMVGQVIDQVTARVEQRLDADLSMAVRATDQAASMIADGELDPQDLRSWHRALYRQVASSGAINSITFGTPDGRATWMIRYPHESGLEYAIKDDLSSGEIVESKVGDRGAPGERIGSYAFDPRERPWYKAALAADKPTWSDIYPWVRRNGGDSTLGIAFTRPIRDAGGQLLGVLDADVGLQAVTEFLRSVKISDSGQAFLVGPDGNLIAASADVAVTTGEGGRILAIAATDPTIRAVVAGISKDAGSLTAIESERRFRLEIVGLGYRVKVDPWRDPWGLNWRTVVVVPEADILAGVTALRRRAWLIGGLVALATLALGMAASQALVRPVLRLVEGVRAIGAGDLDRRVAVTGAREFAQLSAELNRMAADLKDRLKMRHSLALAMEIQQKLLPAAPPKIAGLDLAGHSTYCDKTGGDYYDFLELDETAEGDLVVVLGDVMGHGIAAALLMATARGILRSRATDPGSLGELLTHVNQQLEADTGGERFMTMILLVVDLPRHSIRWASAGHDAPILYDPETDDFIELAEINGLPLGIMPDAEYREAEYDGFGPDRILLVGTDGIWEARSPSGEEYGKDRLRAVIRAHRHETADGIAAAVTEALRHYRGDAHQDDDITFVLAKMR